MFLSFRGFWISVIHSKLGEMLQCNPFCMISNTVSMGSPSICLYSLGAFASVLLGNDCMIPIGGIVVLVLSLTGITVNFCDLGREYYMRIDSVLVIVFLLFLIFISSEALLFVSFFWSFFHLNNPTLGQLLYITDLASLSFVNNFPLSNAAVGFSVEYLANAGGTFCLPFWKVLLLAVLFMFLQVKEL